MLTARRKNKYIDSCKTGWIKQNFRTHKWQFEEQHLGKKSAPMCQWGEVTNNDSCSLQSGWVYFSKMLEGRPTDSLFLHPIINYSEQLLSYLSFFSLFFQCSNCVPLYKATFDPPVKFQVVHRARTGFTMMGPILLHFSNQPREL